MIYIYKCTRAPPCCTFASITTPPPCSKFASLFSQACLEPPDLPQDKTKKGFGHVFILTLSLLTRIGTGVKCGNADPWKWCTTSCVILTANPQTANVITVSKPEGTTPTS